MSSTITSLIPTLIFETSIDHVTDSTHNLIPYSDVIEVSCHLYDNSMRPSIIINHIIIMQ